MPDYLCRVKITNNVEGAVIVEEVCTFYFYDRTPYYNDRDDIIRHGETGYVASNTNDDAQGQRILKG